ncbi:MAG: DUF2892 domain-containing protein [Bacteroidetes bacterium]|nr:MAG: DUF2892 domain-containing protein [Bacteroidota bacterium]
MKKNVGTIDKVIRIILAVIIGALGYYYQSWWGLIAIVPLLTGFIGYCPAWSIFGLSTCKKG